MNIKLLSSAFYRFVTSSSSTGCQSTCIYTHTQTLSKMPACKGDLHSHDKIKGTVWLNPFPLRGSFQSCVKHHSADSRERGLGRQFGAVACWSKCCILNISPGRAELKFCPYFVVLCCLGQCFSLRQVFSFAYAISSVMDCFDQ